MFKELHNEGRTNRWSVFIAEPSNSIQFRHLPLPTTQPGTHSEKWARKWIFHIFLFEWAISLLVGSDDIPKFHRFWVTFWESHPALENPAGRLPSTKNS